MSERAESATAQFKIRVKEPLRAALEEAARRRGGTMNAEIVRRLERSFAEESAFGGPAGFEVASVAASAFMTGGRFRAAGREDWTSDPACYRAALFAAADALLALVPAETEEEQKEIALHVEGLKGSFLGRIVRRKMEQDK